jgi:type IV pilus assembly protein PilV
MQLTSRRRQSGVSLIEVLVSIFVVSMGILALAGLLNASSRLGKASELRATATLLANDLADRMRANPDAFPPTNATSAYDLATAKSYSPAAPTAPTKSETDCAQPKNCTPPEIAAIDLYEWQQRLFYTLPGGQGYVVYSKGDASADKSYGARVDVWVAWTDTQSANNKEGQAIATHECPDAFKSSGTDGKPRCLYLQVGGVGR